MRGSQRGAGLLEKPQQCRGEASAPRAGTEVRATWPQLSPLSEGWLFPVGPVRGGGCPPMGTGEGVSSGLGAKVSVRC